MATAARVESPSGNWATVTVEGAPTLVAFHKDGQWVPVWKQSPTGELSSLPKCFSFNDECLDALNTLLGGL